MAYGKDLHMVKVAVDELLVEVERLRKENARLEFELAEYVGREEQEEKEEIGYYLKSQREARKLSAFKFAKLLNVSDATLKKYERGEGDLKNMQAMAAKVGKLGRKKDE